MTRSDLTVLATSDLHLHLCPWDDLANVPAPRSGLAHVAAAIAHQRQTARNVLLLDNGDFLQGTALGDCLARMHPPRPSRPHPMIAAMNVMGYDAIGLGNHEFNYGLDFLLAALGPVACPVLNANLLRPGRRGPLFAPFVLLDRMLMAEDGSCHACRIGITSVLPPQVVIWDHEHLSGRAVAAGIVETVRRMVAQMRAEGAEVVIVLCHSGIGTPAGGDLPQAEDAALAVAAVEGVDAVVAGHSHLVFPGPAFSGQPGVDVARGRLADKPAAMPGACGSHLARLDLHLVRAASGHWACTGGHGAAIDLRGPAQGPVPDPQARVIGALCTAAQSLSARHLARPAGRISAPISSHFAAIGACGVSRLIGQAMRWHVARELDSTPLAELPVLAAVSAARTGGRGGPGNYTDLPAGVLTERHLAAMFPFPNTLRAVQITGAGLLAWLEHAAGAFRRLDTPDAPLMASGFPAYNLDQIEGLTYEIDQRQPPRYLPGGDMADPRARRIANLCHKGRAVKADDVFVLATNSYRVAGGGYFPGCGAQAKVVLATPTPISTIVGAFLALAGPWDPPSVPVWRFAAMPGQTARFRTGPGARGRAWPAGVTFVGEDAEGFLDMRLHL